MTVHIILLLLAFISTSGDGVYAAETQQCTDPGSCEDSDDTIKAIVDDHDKIPATFKKHLESVEKYELHEMLESLKEIAAEICEDVGVTTLMQRHVERLLIADQFPPGEKVEDDSYATFGSLLDISTEYSASWNGSTEFGGKVSWIGSMFWRKAIIKHENKQPCKTDLSDDYDGSSDSCIHGVTINNYVSVRGNLDKKHEHMELAASWEILGDDQAQWRTGKIMDLNFGQQKFDTIVCNGLLAGTELELQDLDLILKKVTSLLKPGGIIFVIGTEPSRRVNGPENVVNEISDVINSAKTVSMMYLLTATYCAFVFWLTLILFRNSSWGNLLHTMFLQHGSIAI